MLIPAAVFQSVLFGGAYGTGREVAEFITGHGPLGGLFAIAVVGIAFAIVLTLCFELARVLNRYDYRTFFSALIGRGWVAYEILLVVSIPLVIAVNASAASTIMHDQFALPGWIGVLLTFGTVLVISYLGRNAVQNSMAVMAAALVVVLSITATAAFVTGADSIGAAFDSRAVNGGWSTSAIQYSLYNVAVIPLILYCARDIRTTGESVTSGLIAAIAGVFPALVFHVVFMVSYPDILEQPLPVYSILRDLASPAFFLAYVVVLLCMIIATVTGLLHGFNERLDTWHLEGFGQPITPIARAMSAASVMLVSLFLSGIGITTLVANGYGTLAWGYLAVFVLPLLVLAPGHLYRRRGAAGSSH
jgi:uncharacterized membrane protein YkvI